MTTTMTVEMIFRVQNHLGGPKDDAGERLSPNARFLLEKSLSDNPIADGLPWTGLPLR